MAQQCRFVFVLDKANQNVYNMYCQQMHFFNFFFKINIIINKYDV